MAHARRRCSAADGPRPQVFPRFSRGDGRSLAAFFHEPARQLTLGLRPLRTFGNSRNICCEAWTPEGWWGFSCRRRAMPNQVEDSKRCRLVWQPSLPGAAEHVCKMSDDSVCCNRARGTALVRPRVTCLACLAVQPRLHSLVHRWIHSHTADDVLSSHASVHSHTCG
eukprot:354548-Chlamydomonas_euryale.AAC.6